MAQWASFLAVVSGLTVLLLALSRQSQVFIHEFVERDDTDSNVTADSGNADSNDISTGSGRDSADTGGDTAASQDRPVDTDDSLDGTGTVLDAGDTRTNTTSTREGGTGQDDSAVGEGQTGENSPQGNETPVDGGARQNPLPQADDAPATEAGREPAQTGRDLELTSTMMLANVASTQAVFAGVVLAAVWYFSIPATALGVTAEPLARGLPGVGVGLGFGLALWLANELSTTVADAVGAAYDETVRELLAPESPRGWVGLFVVVLPLIAAAEELLFRAALVGVPAAGFGVSPWLLAVVASLAFALGHGAQGTVGIVVTGALGFALAAGFVLTDSLLVVVVAHYVVNAMEFLVHEFLDVASLPLLAPSAG